MKRFSTLLAWFAIGISGSVTTGCQLEKELDDVLLSGRTYEVHVSATKGGEDTRALTLNGKTLNATWTAGDAVTVYKNDREIGSLTAKSSGVNTLLEGSLSGSFSIGDELTLSYLSPGYSTQDGTLDYIASHCDYAVATVFVDNLESEVLSTTPAQFKNQQAVCRFTLTKEEDGSLLYGKKLTISGNGLVGGPIVVTPTTPNTEFYVAMSNSVSDKQEYTFSLVDRCGTSYQKKKKAHLENGKFYSTTLSFPCDDVEYLTFHVTQGGTISWYANEMSYHVEISSNLSLYYSLNGGEWTELTCIPSSSINVSAGDVVRFYGNQWAYSFNTPPEMMEPMGPETRLFQPGARFVTDSSVRFSISGSILSLLYGKSNSIYSEGSFYEFFSNCIGLTDAGDLELPADKSSISCYAYMFSDCTNLKSAPALPAQLLSEECYEGMFRNCTSLESAPVLPAKTLVQACYNGMFSGCTQLNYIKCLAEENMGYGATEGWTYLVSENGTFVKSKNATFWPTGADGIPENWSILSDE